jgi:hypothetical protein
MFLFALGVGLSSAMAGDREACIAACNDAYYACVDNYPTEEYTCWKQSIACSRSCP